MAAKQLELKAEEVQGIARALADPRRYEILRRLRDSRQTMACEAVRDCIGVSAATLSHHMKELEASGLIKVERKGKFAYYESRKDVLAAFRRQLKRDLV